MALVLTIGSVICHSSAEESKSLALSLGNNKLRPRPTMWIVVPFNFIGIHLKTVEGILITVISILDKLSPPPLSRQVGKLLSQWLPLTSSENCTVYENELN